MSEISFQSRIDIFFFKITPQTVYASTKRNDIPSLHSRRLEVVGTSSLFRPLLPSACYAGYDITRGTRVVTSLPGCICFPCCFEGSVSFLEHWLFRAFQKQSGSNLRLRVCISQCSSIIFEPFMIHTTGKSFSFYTLILLKIIINYYILY